MSQLDETFRVETIAALDATETALVSFSEIFYLVAHGEPLHPERAEHLVAQCAVLLEKVGVIRNALRLSGDGPGQRRRQADGKH